MKYALLILCALALASCDHRDDSGPEPAQAKAATSTSAQSAEIGPTVVHLFAIGATVAAAATAAAVFAPATQKVAIPVAAGGGLLAIVPLAIQRFLPYIPWLIVGALVCGVGWALHARALKRVAAKDRTKLTQLYAKVSGATANGKGPTFTELADDLAKHLA